MMTSIGQENLDLYRCIQKLIEQLILCKFLYATSRNLKPKMPFSTSLWLLRLGFIPKISKRLNINGFIQKIDFNWPRKFLAISVHLRTHTVTHFEQVFVRYFGQFKAKT